MLGEVTPLGRLTHPGAFQVPPQLGKGRQTAPSEHRNFLGTSQRPPLARGGGVDVRDLCLPILGEPQQSGEPRFPLEQQVVGKLPGAHLTQGPEGDSGNKPGKVEAPETGSEQTPPWGLQLQPPDKQLSCVLNFQLWGRPGSGQCGGRAPKLINRPLQVLGLLPLPSQA